MRLLIGFCSLLALAACVQPAARPPVQHRPAPPSSTVEGAIIGGLGNNASAAQMIGQTPDGRCRYRDQASGRSWIAVC